jgi:hypothetical protein
MPVAGTYTWLVLSKGCEKNGVCPHAHEARIRFASSLLGCLDQIVARANTHPLEQHALACPEVERASGRTCYVVQIAMQEAHRGRCVRSLYPRGQEARVPVPRVICDDHKDALVELVAS